MDTLTNPFRGTGLDIEGVPATARPSTDADAPARLLARCPAHAETPLAEARALADELGLAALHLKDERARMGLGSFKALGAAYAIAHDAAQIPGERPLAGRTYVAASAGNHGLSLAAGARVFGADAVIYLADTVPESFAERLREKGARVVREGATYEESMAAAATDALREDWVLLSDSSWPGYLELPRRVMEGYLEMAAEAARQIPAPPTHILLQAGVGGMAASVAAHARATWGDAPDIVVVEPEAAPALRDSIREGRTMRAEGPVSAMGRLDCKEPSILALSGLARDADRFVTISEPEAAAAVDRLAAHDLATTPSGAAGVAPLLDTVACESLGIGAEARVLAFLSEGTG